MMMAMVGQCFVVIGYCGIVARPVVAYAGSHGKQAQAERPAASQQAGRSATTATTTTATAAATMTSLKQRSGQYAQKYAYSLPIGPNRT